MLSIPLFIKTDTRHLVCRPTLLPAAMAHSGVLSPAPSRLRARLFPWFIPTLILLRIIIVPHRPRDQAQKNENNLKEYWTQLTLSMRKTTRARFPIGFLIFSYPWFSHTYPHSNRICSSIRIRHISRLFLLPRTPLEVLETEHGSR